jgi:hypothetical protein
MNNDIVPWDDTDIVFDNGFQNTWLLCAIFDAEEYLSNEYDYHYKNEGDVVFINTAEITLFCSFLTTFLLDGFHILTKATTMEYEEFSNSLEYLMNLNLVEISNKRLVVNKKFKKWFDNQYKITWFEKYNRGPLYLRNMAGGVYHFIKNFKDESRESKAEKMSEIVLPGLNDAELFQEPVVDNQFISKTDYEKVRKEVIEDTWCDYINERMVIEKKTAQSAV